MTLSTFRWLLMAVRHSMRGDNRLRIAQGIKLTVEHVGLMQAGSVPVLCVQAGRVG